MVKITPLNNQRMPMSKRFYKRQLKVFVVFASLQLSYHIDAHLHTIIFTSKIILLVKEDLPDLDFFLFFFFMVIKSTHNKALALRRIKKLTILFIQD